MQKVIAFIRRLIEKINEADVFGLSAQLAYFFLLSLFPFLIFLATLLGYLPIDSIAALTFLETYLPDDVMEMVEKNLSSLMDNQSGGLLSIGIIATLWSASKGVNAITKSLNTAYGVEEDRSFVLSRILSVGLTVTLILTISIALLLPVFGREIGTYLFSFVNLSDDFLQVWNMARWIVSSLMFFIVLYVLYILAPNTKVKLKDAFWGALFATISWQIVSLGFSYYVSTLGNFSATYGSLGTVIVLMLWFYMTGIIINTGGVINSIVRTEYKKEYRIDRVLN